MVMKHLRITLDDELYAWLTKEIKEMRFGSYEVTPMLSTML